MKKKLIEVALPLEAINKASAREKSIRHGHPSTLHLWWARRPLAAARAVIFAQMVDDPSSLPDLFTTEQKQKKERERLFRIIEDLVQWENTTNEAVLERARTEIWQSWRRACAENAGHPRAKELFDRHKLPAFHDPFAGGGALPLEAQRLGLAAYASDLNPVAVLINKAMIEIPARFGGRPPVNPQAQREKGLIRREWKGAQGLAEDVRYYGQWMRDEAEKRIGHLYPKIEVTPDMAKERPDLKPYLGQKLTVIAWLWARTVKSPNPAFAKVDVPLASTFMLSTKVGKEAYVEPIIDGSGYRFTVKVEKPKDPARAKSGTKLSRGANFECLMSGTPISGDYIKAEGRAGRMGARLMAIVAEGQRGRVYLPPTPEHESAARKAKPEWKPDVEFFQQALGFRVGSYGMTKWSDLFTDRQLAAMTTFSELVGEALQQVHHNALNAGLPNDATPLRDSGTGAAAYAEAVATYLGFGVSKAVDMCNSLCAWGPTDWRVRHLFARQAIPMTWDFAETCPLNDSAGAVYFGIEYLTKALDGLPTNPPGVVLQADAAVQVISANKVVSTDPPYYDNVGYADLSMSGCATHCAMSSPISLPRLPCLNRRS
jgi:putative DNA methylase